MVSARISPTARMWVNNWEPAVILTQRRKNAVPRIHRPANIDAAKLKPAPGRNAIAAMSNKITAGRGGAARLDRVDDEQHADIRADLGCVGCTTNCAACSERINRRLLRASTKLVPSSLTQVTAVQAQDVAQHDKRHHARDKPQQGHSIKGC